MVIAMHESSAHARLQILEDREAIKELLALYAWNTARADVEALVAAYTETGGFESRGVMRFKGELLDFFQVNVRPQARIPLVVNHLIQVNGDDAQGSSTMYSPWSPDGFFCGFYEDIFRRENGVWRFEKRKWTYYSRPASLAQ